MVVRTSFRVRRFEGGVLLVAVSLLLALLLFPKGISHASLGTTAPDFTLPDQNGMPFTLSRQRGHPVVLFFGYTHCPDVCPTTLGKLARVIATTRLENDARVVFITVDPQRDTPSAMKAYLSLFDPRFIGLTGARRDLAPVFAAYDVWNQELPSKRAGEYSVTHGSAVYYIDRGGDLRAIGDWEDSMNEITRHLQEASLR